MSLFRFPDLRLTVKLPLLIVATALAVAAAASITASWTTYATAERWIDKHLTVIAESKRDQLDGLMRAVRSDLQSIAGNPAVQHSLDGFGIGFKLLSFNDRAGLRKRFIENAATSAGAVIALSDFYGAAHQSMDPWFRTFAVQHGYRDILFIDRDGNVAYSLAKRSDFTRNIADPALAQSALGQAAAQAKALRAGETTVTDFSVYGPTGRPISFAATPVFQKLGDKQDFVGVLVVQLPSEAIDYFLNKADGFGSQGEAIIVGPDGLLRSNSRFGAGGDILRRRFDDPALLKAGAHDGVVFTKGYRGSMVAAAVPFRLGNLTWTVIAAESTDDVFAPVHHTVFWIVACCLVLAVLLMIGASFLSRRMARPIVELAERFEAALTNMPHGLSMFDSAHRLILANATYNRMYRLPAEMTVAQTPASQLIAHRNLVGTAPADIAAYSDRLVEVANSRDPTASRVQLQDGRIIQITAQPLASGGFVAAHQDITEAIRAEDKIRYMAAHDALTGLPNRLRLRERMEEALAWVARGDKLAVLCLDLDHFKAVNDTLGHPIGDLLLQGVTARIRDCLRDTDTIARLGGDEFVVVQVGIEEPENAGVLAQRLIAAISEPYMLDGHQVVVGASIGIAFCPTDGNDADVLLKNADLALYRAKADGRGTCRFFETTMDARLQERRRLELDLRRALISEEFELYFQPLVNTLSEEISGFEALLRWNHPTRGLVGPNEFIPLAEDIGLIVPLGEWVIRHACHEAGQWPAGLKVAVNLSPAQFKSPTLLHTVVSALGQSGLSPRRLELEITESVLLGDNAATLATLHQLRDLGIRIAMDDFGTGYSSLSYLRSFPFDKIKIDKAFVHDLADTVERTAIIKAVAGLGAALGMATTAEGVETAEQFRQVRDQGCTEVQGYFFSRPVPAASVAGLLDANAVRKAG